MPTFFYKAKEASGNDAQGEVEANDGSQALSILRERKLIPYFLKEQIEPFFNLFFKRLFQKATLAGISTFVRQLSTMISAGLPLTNALIILKSQSAGAMAETAGMILRDVESGSSLADSWQKMPEVFSPVHVALIRAGESAGVLDNMLTRLADNMEAQKEFRAKVKGAMIYPIIVIIAMAGVAAVMMLFVIPKMMAVYNDFGAKLPQSTQMLMSFSAFTVKFWWLMLILIAGLIYGFRVVSTTKKGRKKIDELKFKIPLIGNLQKQVILAEITRTLGLLVGAGVSIVEALQITGRTADNVLISEGIDTASKKVEKGLPLSTAIADNLVFPKILPQMLSVGEETGKIDEVLLKLSHFFQSESEEMLKGLTSAIEPLIMILLGIGVAFLVIAVIMPIYSLTGQM